MKKTCEGRAGRHVQGGGQGAVMTLPYKPAQAPSQAIAAPDDAASRNRDGEAPRGLGGAPIANGSVAQTPHSALVSFFVPGKPAKKGSHNSRAFVGAGGQLGSYTYDADKGLTKWAKAVHVVALAAVREQRGTGYTPTIAPVAVRVTFLFARPKSHGLRWGTRGKPRLLPPPTSRMLGDVDKLCRGFLDSLTGVVWQDDSQVVRLEAEKAYAEVGEVPGARVVVLEVQT